MTKRWIMDGRARASRKYRELHEQLRREVKADRKLKRFRHGDAGQRSRFAASELFRMLSETN